VGHVSAERRAPTGVRCPHGASWRGGQVIAHFTLFVSSGCKSRLGKRRSAE